MTGWKEYKLGELTVDGKGHYGIAAPSADYNPDGYTYLRITDINDDGTLNKNGLKSVEEKGSENYLLQPNDIVFARTGASVGRSYFYDGRDGELVYAGFLIKYSIDSAKVNPKILKFYTHSQAYYDWIKTVDNGATRGNVNAQTFASMPILLPERKVQDEIVNILSSLDDKIDLLRRENTTLEHMAETLFRQWFVEGAKEEWQEGKLGNEFDFTMGQSPSGDSFNEEGSGVPMYQGNADFGFRFPARRVFTTQPTRFAEVNDTLISVRAPVGAQNMALERCCIGRGVAAFRYKNNPYYYSYTYYKLKSLLEEIKQFNDNGTVFGSITKSDFENIDIVIPDENAIMHFQQQVKVIDDKIINNNREIQNLIQTRDGLLPRLMSGEVIL